MKILQELKERFFQKKRGASSPRKTTAKGEEREIMTPACPTLVVRRRSSESDVFAKRQQERKEQLKQSLERKTFRSRDQTMSCNSYFAEHTATRPYMRDRMLTENAKHLSPEQLQALEMDIFKPLDFYEILFNRMKAKDNENSDRGRSSWLLKTIEQIDSNWLHSLTEISRYFDWLFVSDYLGIRFKLCINIYLLYCGQIVLVEAWYVRKIKRIVLVCL